MGGHARASAYVISLVQVHAHSAALAYVGSHRGGGQGWRGGGGVRRRGEGQA